MKFKQYLTENQNLSIKDTLQMLYQQCMPFIKDIVRGGYSYYTKNHDLLYSGRNENKPVFIKTVRKSRKPSDTNYDIHLLMDKLFHEKFGIKGRSQTLFCTGDSGTAGGYGWFSYMIFPVGKYKALWSDEIRDMYKNPYLDQIIDSYIPIINAEVDKKVKDSLKKELEDEIYKKILPTYHVGNIMKAIQSGNEIMIDTKRFIALRWGIYNYPIKSYIDKYGTKFPSEENLTKWYEIYGDALPYSKSKLGLFN